MRSAEAMGVCAVALAALLLAGAPGAAEEAPALLESWYAEAYAQPEGGGLANVTYFWSKGPKLRSETIIGGLPVVTIVSGDTYYAYERLGGTGIAVSRALRAIEQDAARERPFGNEAASLLRQGGELVGREQVGGAEVDLFRLTDTRGRRQVWATTGPERLTLRVEIYRRATAKTSRIEFFKWQRGLAIADRFFEPDPRLGLARLSYEEYREREGRREGVGSVPVLYGDLLHGEAR